MLTKKEVQELLGKQNSSEPSLTKTKIDPDRGLDMPAAP
jgi:hypothetical protein